MKEKSILNSPLYKVLRYGYYFLLTNLLFLVANVLFFLVFFSVPLLIENVFWYTVALLPAGPAFTALYFCMGLLVRQEDISPVRDFLRAYWDNFFISLKFWGIQLILLMILGVDALYFLAQGNTVAGVLFGILTVLVGLITLIGISLLATFEITLPNVYRAAVVILWREWKKQLLNSLTVGAFFVLLYAFPSELFLFVFALSAFYLMRNHQAIFVKMAQQFGDEGGKGIEEE